MSTSILDTFIYILSVLLISCSAVPVTSLNDPLKKVPDLVDLLKQDLRRNNDDYIEMTTKTISRPPNTQTTTKLNITPASVNYTYATNQDFKQANVLNNQGPFKGGHNRRNIEEEEENDDEQSNAEKDSERTTINKTEDLPVQTEDSPVHTEEPPDKVKKAVNSDIEKPKDEAEYLNLPGNKQKKFKNFVETNQKLFNEFISKKQAEVQLKVVQPRSKDGAMNNNRAGMKQEPVMRARYDNVVNPPYNERQLDMAPAKGGRIHALRMKGRLCQRNVLLPEGPKYDSQGTVYLGAYQANGGRDYSHTREPKIVLPRCCNCCKKSVLGCE